MQVLIRHSLPEKLVLPIGYHHILQAIIYHEPESVLRIQRIYP